MRVIEMPDGQWACRRGREVIDTHLDLERAVEHLSTLAAEIGPTQLFLHRLDGTVRDLGIV